jgi:hypothetical protein
MPLSPGVNRLAAESMAGRWREEELTRARGRGPEIQRLSSPPRSHVSDYLDELDEVEVDGHFAFPTVEHHGRLPARREPSLDFGDEPGPHGSPAASEAAERQDSSLCEKMRVSST